MDRPLISPSAVNDLLSWFEKDGVVYPWGADITPYRVWVSEVMLQQTVITGVVPYFRRWMERFPRLEDLAAAEEPEVLKLWEGLGYYSRARNLLAAARIVRDQYGGELPGDLDRLKALPGIGEYTARAVLSIAFGRPVAVLDANVKRVGRRILALEDFGKAEEEALARALEASVPPDRPGDFNAALMQLGQLVCRLNSPGCLSCPLGGACRAFREDLAGKIPRREKRETIPKASDVFVYVRDGKVFLYRKEKGLGAGLYTLPRRERRTCESAPGGKTDAPAGGEALAAQAMTAQAMAAQAMADQAMADQAMADQAVAAEAVPAFLPPSPEHSLRSGPALSPRIHSYTKYRESLFPRIFFLRSGSPGPQEAAGTLGEYPGIGAEEARTGTWFSPDALPGLAVFSVYRQILNEAAEAVF